MNKTSVSTYSNESTVLRISFKQTNRLIIKFLNKFPSEVQAYGKEDSLRGAQFEQIPPFVFVLFGKLRFHDLVLELVLNVAWPFVELG